MDVAAEIRERLTQAFAPTELKVVNESHRHAGHGGDDGSGESHFAVRLRSDQLAPMTRLARHRAVQAALGDLTRRIHALALDLG